MLESCSWSAAFLGAIALLHIESLSAQAGKPAVDRQQDTLQWKLVWADEFNRNGPPDTSNWQYETGFVRNHELQWYQPGNAWCHDGKLVIEARKEVRPNPLYNGDTSNWRRSRQQINYTSTSMRTRPGRSWKFGRFELRARIDTTAGLWPAWWTLGIKGEWPSNGEIDIMEYYRGMLLANMATGTDKRYKAHWYTTTRPVAAYPKDWVHQFHTWRMDWNENEISLYVDDQLLNNVAIKDLVNRDGSGINPFLQEHYMILNLAVGGDNGGDPSGTSFPRRYEIDYVRVYQR